MAGCPWLRSLEPNEYGGNMGGWTWGCFWGYHLANKSLVNYFKLIFLPGRTKNGELGGGRKNGWRREAKFEWPGPVRLRSGRLCPRSKHLVRPRRHFFKISSICRRRDDTWFFECAFGVDETLGGKRRFLTMCVLRRRDATLQTEFPIVSPEINVLVSARWRIRFLKYVFGVDETSHF